jgi:hypothetical protein
MWSFGRGEECNRLDEGVNVMITNFGDFHRFFGEKMALFSTANVMNIFSAQTSVISVKSSKFFLQYLIAQN